MRLRPDRGEVRARRRAGRDRPPVAGGFTSHRFAFPQLDALRLRARLLRPAGLDGLRPQRRRLPARPSARAWRGASGAGGRRRPGAGLRHVRRLGYAAESSIPFGLGLVRNHYVGRTFIEPKQSIRHFGVKVKLNPVREVVDGKRIVLVDDSIVRGTTSRKIVRMLREAGAREVHVRVSSPPTMAPATTASTRRPGGELIAANQSVDEIREFIEADSLGYLSVEGMLEAFGRPLQATCTACFTGVYPVEIEDEEREKESALDAK